jgi:hypothetical protein
MTSKDLLDRDPKLAELVRRLIAAHQPRRPSSARECCCMLLDPTRVA